MTMQVTHWLRSLAEAAICHAKEQHGFELEKSRSNIVDMILDVERSRGSSEDRQSIILCYGAWLGEWAVNHVKGQWVGLAEPTPPRILVNGVLTSPMDAVERRLLSDRSPSMELLVEQWQTWYESSQQDDLIRMQNRSAWDARRTDPRFVNTSSLPNDRQEAIAAVDPWLVEEGSIEGRRVLCLAAGGGMHGPLLSLAGADVTVVDFSDEQLAVDRQLAERYGLKVHLVNASIDNLSALVDNHFDTVVQPVSTCYVRNLSGIYSEVARVLRPNGLYIAQHKQPTSLQAEMLPTKDGFVLRHQADEGCVLSPSIQEATIRESEMTEYVHTWEALVGGLCRYGFVIEDLLEPPRGDAWAPVGSSEHRARYLPPYVKIKARKTA